MPDKGWSRQFFEPIETDDGRKLKTLRDAGEYIQALPAKTARLDHWQTAARELLISAEQGGILMLSEIAMRTALHHGKPEPEKGLRRKTVKRYRIIR